MSQQEGGAGGAVVGWVLRDRGWSQERFGKAVGHGQSWVSQVMSGQRSPTFNAVVDALAKAGYDFVLVGGDSSKDGRSVRRRRFLIDIGTVAGLAPIGAAVPLVSGTPDLRDAEAVTALTRRYVALEQEIGGAAIFAPAVRVARRLMRQIDAGDALGVAHLSAAGWFFHEVGWLAYDSGRRPAAESFGSHALRLAEHAGDRRLQARACNLLSIARASAKDGLGAAKLARRGISAAQDDNALERTLLWARLARAEAKRGPEGASQAMKALQRAQEAAVDGRDTYEVVANRGIVLAELGRFTQASAALASAADIIGRMGEPRNRCIYLIRSAKVAVQQGELEESAKLVDQLLDEGRDITSARIDGHLHEWMALTASPRISSASSIRDARGRARDHLVLSAPA